MSRRKPCAHSPKKSIASSSEACELYDTRPPRAPAKLQRKMATKRLAHEVRTETGLDGRFGQRHAQVRFAHARRARNIMPMVPRSSRFITLFTHYTVRAFASNDGRNSQKVSTFSARCQTARLADSLPGLSIPRRARPLPL